MQSNYELILSRYWGYDKFRSLQDQIVASIGSGHDTLGLMPTGGGKSITFQVPAMATLGLCLVITPLVALMRDQVAALCAKDIKAVYIHAGMSKEEIISTLDNCIYGQYKFLYISPERLSSDVLIARIHLLNINFIAVDEAHCISQWGYDFRPSFMKIKEIRNYLPHIPILALTATATPEVVKDIQVQLQFREPKVFQKSFERKNLIYLVRTVDDKLTYLLKILQQELGTAIVYTRSRAKTKEISELLNQHGICAEFYHAGLNHTLKEEVQSRWMTGESRVMVATNAFGMGIDKPDVRVVIHLDVPDSIEAYFQEAGRAGRDGLKAYAVLLHQKIDSSNLKRRINDTYPPIAFIRKVYDHLGSYFQVAEGFGMDRSFRFEIFSFCKNYKLNRTHVHNALKVLDLEGYITYQEESNPASLVQFLQSRDSLYHLRLNSSKLDQLVLLILRTYSGVFTQLTTINEELMAERLGMKQQELYNSLSYLSKLGVLQYIPKIGSAQIIYRDDRIDPKYLQFRKENYVARKNSYEKRIHAVIEYLNDESICRSQYLLSYFGETKTNRCGKCDVCKEKLPQDTSSIQEQLLVILATSPRSIHDIDTLFFNQMEEVKQVLRLLMERQIITLKGNYIMLVE